MIIRAENNSRKYFCLIDVVAEYLAEGFIDLRRHLYPTSVNNSLLSFQQQLPVRPELLDEEVDVDEPVRAALLAWLKQAPLAGAGS